MTRESLLRCALLAAMPLACGDATPRGQDTPSALFSKYQDSLRNERWEGLFECHGPALQEPLLLSMVQLAILQIPYPRDGNTFEPFLEKHGVRLGTEEPLETQIKRVRDRAGLFAGAARYLDEQDARIVGPDKNERYLDQLKWPATWELLGVVEREGRTLLRVRALKDGLSRTFELACLRSAGIWVIGEVVKPIHAPKAVGTTPLDLDRLATAVLELRLTRAQLREHPDPAALGEALRKALHDDARSDHFGKLALLEALDDLGIPEACRDALGAESVPTRRAAADHLLSPLSRDKEGPRERAASVVLDWLRDRDAPDRGRAAKIAGDAALVDAVPVLEALLAQEPGSRADVELNQEAIEAYALLAPEEAAASVLAWAADADLPTGRRAAAFRALSSLPELPEDRVRTLALEALKDAGNGLELRLAAAKLLERPELAGGESSIVLTEVLVRPGDEAFVQDAALELLADRMEDDATRRLLLDPRVRGHPHDTIRTKVATGLARLRADDPEARKALCDLLVDSAQAVRAEAWIALWSLTGRTHGIARPETLKKDTRLREESIRQMWGLFRPLETLLDDPEGTGLAEIGRLAADPEASRRAGDAFLADLGAR